MSTSIHIRSCRWLQYIAHVTRPVWFIVRLYPSRVKDVGVCVAYENAGGTTVAAFVISRLEICYSLRVYVNSA